MISKAKWLLGIAMAWAIYYSFVVPGAGRFSEPELARILFFHLPNPILASICQIGAAWFSFLYLRTEVIKNDAKALALSELGVIFSINTMLTGMIFSKVQWGAWWQSDPRQTSYLIVTCLFLAYLVLRSTISDPQGRARKAAAYNMIALLPELYLTFVYPRLSTTNTFHPNDTIVKRQLDTAYGISITVIITLVMILAFWLYRMRVKSLELENEIENGQLEIHLNGSAPTGVVRPVSVPDKG